MAEHQRCHLSGADAENGLVIKAVEDGACKIDGDAGNTQTPGGKICALMHFLRRGEGTLEQGVKDFSDGVRIARLLIGLLHLRENLRFTDDHGVERTRYRK